MNERITVLAASCFPRDTEGEISATPEMIAEFAELIVRECANVIYDADYQGPTISNLILKHFGVK